MKQFFTIISILVVFVMSTQQQQQVNAFETQYTEDSECQKEFKKQCGKQMDNLKRLIHADKKDFNQIVDATKSVIKCVSDKKESLKKKCLPGDINMFIEQQETSQNSFIQVTPCDDIVNKLCGTQVKKLEELLLAGAEPQDIVRGCRDLISCLIKNDGEIAKFCGKKNNLIIANNNDNDDRKPCKDVIKNRCRKQIDALEKAIDETSITGIVSGAFAVASCIVENAKGIWERCKPFEEEEQQKRDILFLTTINDAQKGKPTIMEASFVNKDSESKCHKALYSKCGKQLGELKQDIKDVSVLGMWGSSLEVAGCITENAQYLIKECVSTQTYEEQQFLNELAPAANLGDGQCKKVLRQHCGKQFDTLKKEIEETSINGILSATFAVASCLTENFQDIIRKCVPFEEQQKQYGPLFEFNEVSSDDESKCHKELYKKCGDDIKKLKEGVKNTAVLEIIGSSLKLNGCIIRNFQDLLNNCLSKDNEMMMLMNNNNNNHFNGEVSFDIQDCVKETQKECSTEYNAIKNDIESHRFDLFVADITVLGQCIGDRQSNIQKHCVKNVMDVAIRAMLQSHHHRHHYLKNNDQEISAFDVFSGEIGNEQFYEDLSQPIFKSGHHHLHHIIFPIVFTMIIFFAGFGCARKCNKRPSRFCCNKKSSNDGSLQYQPLVADDLKTSLTA